MKPKLTALLLCAIIFVAVFPAAGAAGQPAMPSAEEAWDDVVAFDSEEQVTDRFGAYFASTQNSRRRDEFSYSWEIADGTLRRTNNVDAARDTVNIAILTYERDIYSDFELSVDFKTGTATGYWPAVCVRQQMPGKYYTALGGGAGVFMQQEGKITLWGPIAGGIVEKSIPNSSGYYAAVWHNMRIRCEGTVITVWLDGAEVCSVAVANTDYSKGYVSLQSVNNDCSFDNFKIRALHTNEEVGNEPNRYPGAAHGTPLDELAIQK